MALAVPLTNKLGSLTREQQHPDMENVISNRSQQMDIKLQLWMGIKMAI
jgi:hypothetical protein